MDGMITQSQYMRLYNDMNREQFNPAFFERKNEDIVNAAKKLILSCERDKYFTLKVLEIREIYNYEEIINLLRDHEEKKRKKNSKADNPYDYIDINDSDIMLLEIRYLLRHNGTEFQKIDGKDTIIQNPWEIMTVLLALPRFSRKYYLRLNGNYYSNILQIVDGATYNNANISSKSKKAPCNTFKSMFTPIKMFKLFKDMQDYRTKEVVRNTVFTTIINTVYNNKANCMLFLLANFGLGYLFDFLEIKCIRLEYQPIESEEWYCFHKHNIFVCVPRVCLQDIVVQALVVTLWESIDSSAMIYDLYDIRYWLTVLGKSFGNASIDKGLFILDSLDGTYEILTKESLHLPDECKTDIYCILRWLMREFNYNRKKNNVDVTIKRFRIGEALVAPLAKKFTIGLSRISDMGKKVTLYKVKKAVYVHPMYLIGKIINMSNLVTYRDLPNDNDAVMAIKYTYKGISGLGDSGTTVAQSYRYVDPSHAGILDLDSSTSSDPGMSGTVCPFATVYEGNTFSEFKEPNFWRENYLPIERDFFNKHNECDREEIVNPLEYIEEPKTDWSYFRNKAIQESLEIDKPICPIYDVNNPDADFTIAGAQLQIEKQETENIQSLFTVRKDDEVDEFYEDD